MGEAHGAGEQHRPGEQRFGGMVIPEPEFPGDDAAAEKAGYETFMLKEIHEQPAALRDTLVAELAPQFEGLDGAEKQLKAAFRSVTNTDSKVTQVVGFEGVTPAVVGNGDLHPGSGARG